MPFRRHLLVSGALVVSALGGDAPDAGAVEIVNTSGTSVPAQAGQNQTGRVNPSGGSASSCGAIEFSPTAQQTGSTFRYTNHTFRSRLTNSVCVTAQLTASCAGGVPLYSAAYVGAFNPSDVLENFVAHSPTGGPPQTYSFAPPGGSPFAIVVHTTTPDTDCSSYSLRVTSFGPWATQAPAIVGDPPAVGNSIIGNNAQWQPTPAPTTVARQWRRCNATGANCADIPGATGQNYTVTTEDLGHTLRFRNNATDAEATNTSDSAVVEPFIPFESHDAESLGPGDRVHNGIFVRDTIDSHCGAPKTAPTVLQPISNFLYDQIGVQSLLNEPVCLVVRTLPGCGAGVSPAIYSPAFVPTAGIQQNYAGNSGTAFTAVNFASSTLPAGARNDVVVSIGNSASVCGVYSVTVGADAPFALARPTVAGTAAEGAPLTAGDGTWSGSPAFGYAWLRCDADGAACAPIDGAAAASYTPTAADAGSRLRVRVTATQGRSVSADSDPTGVIAAAPPTGPGGNPPGGGGGAGVADTTGPKARLALARTTLQKVVKTGVVPVSVTCDEACTLTLRADVTRKLGKRLGGVKIASGKGTLKAGRKTTVKVKLTRKARKGLRRMSSVPFTLKATATDAAGNKSAATKKARVRRKR